MSGPTEFTIGSEVSSSDGPCGELRRVVIDPVARALTHLVVEPKHGRGKGHLVPINLVVSTTDGIDWRVPPLSSKSLMKQRRPSSSRAGVGNRVTSKTKCCRGPITGGVVRRTGSGVWA